MHLFRVAHRVDSGLYGREVTRDSLTVGDGAGRAFHEVGKLLGKTVDGRLQRLNLLVLYIKSAVGTEVRIV